MKNILIIIPVFLALIFTACNKTTGFEEPTPVTNITQIPGHEFYMKGTIGGEPFELKHISKEEKNLPINMEEISSGRPYYGTYFTKKVNNKYVGSIQFSITNGADLTLPEIVKVGDWGWYNFTTPTTSSSEAFIENLLWDGVEYTSTLQPQLNNFNEFTVTNVESLNLDENLSDIYGDKVYKVEGNFKTILYTWDNVDNDTIQLVVDEFSAIFRDRL